MCADAASDVKAAAAVADKFAMVRRAIDSGRPAQAYLITGSIRGEAMALALRIVQYLFCTGNEKPCGTCQMCEQIERRVFADVHWLHPEKKSRIFSVEQIRRELLPVMQQTSLIGGWKVAVLVGADRMKDAAANALLKTLEEPSPDSMFLLLSDTPQEILPTILSRCQRIDLQDVRDLPDEWREQVLEVLANSPLNSLAGRTAAALQLVTLLKEMKDAAETEVMAENKAQQETQHVDEDDDVLDAKISARYREQRSNFLMTLNKWFRDLLVAVSGGDDGVLFYPQYAEVYSLRAAGLTRAQALMNLERVERIAKQFDSNMPENMVLPYWMDRFSHGVK